MPRPAQCSRARSWHWRSRWRQCWRPAGRRVDILVWGAVALILQLLTLGAVALGMRNFRGMIEGGNVAAAITLAGAQIAVALLNAAAMVPN